MAKTFKQEIILHIVKALDIAILGNVYLFIGVIVSSLIDKYVAKDYDKKKSKFQNLLQLLYETGIIMISVYLIRTFIKHIIPNPLKGIGGFDPSRVKELGGGLVLAFAFLMYLKDKIKSKVEPLYNFVH